MYCGPVYNHPGNYFCQALGVGLERWVVRIHPPPIVPDNWTSRASVWPTRTCRDRQQGWQHSPQFLWISLGMNAAKVLQELAEQGSFVFAQISGKEIFSFESVS